MNIDEINTAGIWLLRLILVIGAVVAVLLGKTDTACQLSLALIATFFLL